jgi:hypothetical protein
MNAKKEETKPGWLNIKNILGVLAALGVLGGGGAAVGYNQKDSQEIQVQHVDTKEVLNGLYDVMEMNQRNQSEKDKNQNQRIDNIIDEVRTTAYEQSRDIREIKQDIKEIKKCMEEKNLTDKKNETTNLTTIE